MLGSSSAEVDSSTDPSLLRSGIRLSGQETSNPADKYLFYQIQRQKKSFHLYTGGRLVFCQFWKSSSSSMFSLYCWWDRSMVWAITQLILGVWCNYWNLDDDLSQHRPLTRGWHWNRLPDALPMQCRTADPCRHQASRIKSTGRCGQQSTLSRLVLFLSSQR